MTDDREKNWVPCHFLGISILGISLVFPKHYLLLYSPIIVQVYSSFFLLLLCSILHWGIFPLGCSRYSPKILWLLPEMAAFLLLYLFFQFPSKTSLCLIRISYFVDGNYNASHIIFFFLPLITISFKVIP